MSKFTKVRKGYDMVEVDKYVNELESVVKSYKEKDIAIKNAILNAQIAADNIIKNSKNEAAAYKDEVIERLHLIDESIKFQKTNVQEFKKDYDDLLNKYLLKPSSSDFVPLLSKIDSLSSYVNTLLAPTSISELKDNKIDNNEDDTQKSENKINIIE